MPTLRIQEAQILLKRADYSDQPTIVVAIAEGGEVIGAHVEGFAIPDRVRLIVRDFSAGEEADEDGLIYDDRELLPGEASPSTRVNVAK